MLPPIRHISVIISVIALTLPAIAETRAWRNADGTRSIQGEFVDRTETGVNIRRSNGKQIAIPFDKLHADDHSWLDANHPLSAANATTAEDAVFDHLVFGDNRTEVLKKLMASQFLQRTANDKFIGRTGLNGIFRTREKIGGLDASLYFDWTESGGLNEITLQTDPLPEESLNDRLTPCWKGFIRLLTTLHGAPVNANNNLDITPLQDGAMSGTHLWKLEPSGSVLLGAAREGDNYQIAVRFTTEVFKPVVKSGPASASP